MNEINSELYPQAAPGGGTTSIAHKKAKKALKAELIGGITGLILSGFICGHLILEGTSILGVEIYDKVAYFMEHTLPLAQIVSFVIPIVFLLHFIYAGRKIPGRLYERKRILELGLSLKKSRQKWNQKSGEYTTLRPHAETSAWIWQVRTGMIVLALGSFHLVLAVWNVFSDMGLSKMGVDIKPGLQAAISYPRVESGLWILYLALGITVVIHMCIGLYRLAVKWLADTRLSRKAALILVRIVFWFYIVLNVAGVMALAGFWKGVTL